MTFDPPQPHVAPPVRPDSVLSDGWRSVVLVTWLLVFGCTAAIAVSSRTTGRSIWWLGPSVDPAPVFFVILPIAIVVFPMWAAMKRPAIVARSGIICSVLLGITALPDAVDRPGVAVAMATVSVAALLASVSVAVVARH